MNVAQVIEELRRMPERAVITIAPTDHDGNILTITRSYAVFQIVWDGHQVLLVPALHAMERPR